MAYIEWSESLSVGVKHFDTQHHKLVEMVNELYDALSSGRTNDIIGEIFNRLIDYTVEHFKSEEELFEKYGYDKAKQHTDEHNDLVQDVLSLKEKFEAGDITISYETMTFLQNWLTEHILKSDMDYKDFFNQKGVY